MSRYFVCKVKEKLISTIPDCLFTPMVNTYYALWSNKGRLRISRENGWWLLSRERVKLFSPTPKFLAFGFKHFEAKFERFFKVERGETVLDVGACIGDTTVPMLSKVGTEGYVIAVEPCPVNVEYLKLNTSQFGNIELVPKAAWNKTGTITLNIHSSPTGHTLVEPRAHKP